MGNPGEEYARTRHNAGFMVVDRVAEVLGCRFRKPFLRSYLLAQASGAGGPLYLAKPLTYMNRSGEVLDQLVLKSRCSLDELLVVCDNLDLPVGSCRLKLQGSSAGHNGLGSLIEHAGTSDFKRIYVGIGRPAGGGIIEHVLGAPGGDEARQLAEAVEIAAQGVLAALEEPIDRVMNGLNRRQP